MLIQYFSRNILCGYSISRVFAPIIEHVSNEHQVFSYTVPSQRADPISIIRNLWFVFKNRNSKGINHITGDIHYCILALIGCKPVLTIHDLGFIHNELDVKSEIYSWYRKIFWIYLPCLIAKKIICISDKTAETLKSHISERQQKKISVIYNAVDEIYSYSPKLLINAKPVILHVGTKSNKNLDRVIVALKDVNCSLHIVGKLSKIQMTLLHDSHIEFRNEVDLNDVELVARFKDCDIVSFPSLYEGFGMPIIEAQTTGRPVVTSNISPMNVVAGKGAYFVNPFDIESIKEGFMDIILNTELQKLLIREGRENIKRFDVKVIANQYANLYEEVFSNTDSIRFKL